MPNLKLGSCDGEILVVESEIAKQSLTIRDMLNILGMDDMCGEIVPIPNVTAAILRKVIEWITFHKEDSEHIRNKKKEITPWDATFLNVEQETLVSLCRAAHYLIINGVVDQLCQIMASHLKGKTPEELQKILGLDKLAKIKC